MDAEDGNLIETLSFTKEIYTARLIRETEEEEREAYQKLRYKWFVQRRRWVHADPTRPGCEADRYDPYCQHLGVFQEARLVAYLRVLPWQSHPGLMLQHEFQNLVPLDISLNVAQKGNAEISRLVVDPPPGSGHRETALLAELLFKLLYQVGKESRWNTYYIVLEESWLRVLNRRFTVAFSPLSAPQTFADGTRTLAAYAPCKALEESMLVSAPDKYHWYRQCANGEKSDDQVEDALTESDNL